MPVISKEHLRRFISGPTAHRLGKEVPPSRMATGSQSGVTHGTRLSASDINQVLRSQKARQGALETGGYSSPHRNRMSAGLSVKKEFPTHRHAGPWVHPRGSPAPPFLQVLGDSVGLAVLTSPLQRQVPSGSLQGGTQPCQPGSLPGAEGQALPGAHMHLSGLSTWQLWRLLLSGTWRTWDPGTKCEKSELRGKHNHPMVSSLRLSHSPPSPNTKPPLFGTVPRTFPAGTLILALSGPAGRPHPCLLGGGHISPLALSFQGLLCWSL